MDKSKIVSTLIATSLALGATAKADYNNVFEKLEKYENKIEWNIPNDLLIKKLEEEKAKLYQEYLKSQKEICEYYHKLENPEFPKYDLTEQELIEIARLCEQEQSSLEGTAAEASLMANRYELCNCGYSSLYNYIKDSGWFANSSYYMSSGNASLPSIEIVRKVLVEGKRTIPKYVTEHDITNINTGNVYDKSSYIPDETIIHNVYGLDYIYYNNEGSSDPFGYKLDNKQNISDEHYTYERVINPLP